MDGCGCNPVLDIRTALEPLYWECLSFDIDRYVLGRSKLDLSVLIFFRESIWEWKVWSSSFKMNLIPMGSSHPMMISKWSILWNRFSRRKAKLKTVQSFIYTVNLSTEAKNLIRDHQYWILFWFILLPVIDKKRHKNNYDLSCRKFVCQN